MLLPLVTSFLLSFVLGWPASVILRRLGVIDRPNARSSHSVPTVRGGGVAIIATVLGGLLYLAAGPDAGAASAALALAAGLGLLALVSFIDDLRSLGPAIRFGCHGLVAVLVLWMLGVPTPPFPGAWALGLMWAVGFLWIAGYTNAFNFMDGINGLAAGQATLTALGTAGLALLAGLPVGHPVVWLSCLVAGASAGFLPHNFPRARMFMGDVSSAPLGCLLAALGWWLASAAGWSWLIAVGLLHANFVLDTAFTLLRRVARGERWYEAHREHFYQRLIRSGKSHPFVTGWEMALQVAVLGVLWWAGRGQTWFHWITATLVVGALWGGLFVFAERRFKASGLASSGSGLGGKV